MSYLWPNAILKYPILEKSSINTGYYRPGWQIWKSAQQKSCYLGRNKSKVKQLERYYREAQKKFAWNIKKAREQKVQNPVVDSSVTMFIRMSYLQGQVYEEIAHILATAPVPDGLHGKDSLAYIDRVEEAVLGFIDEALKRYGEGVMLSHKLKIDSNPDLDIVVARIREINPLSKYLDKETTALTSSDPADTSNLFLEGVKDSTKINKEKKTSSEQ